MVRPVWLIALLLCPVASWAHDEKQDRATMTVTGTSQISLAPDTAFVTLGKETAGKSLAEAQRQNRAVMVNVVKRLRELEIEPSRIQTASFTVSPQYKPPPKRLIDVQPSPPEIVGYLVSNSVTVEVHNLEKVGAVIEESLAAGANRFHGLHWALRHEQEAKRDALKQAASKAVKRRRR